jgi:hypothetical protein
MAQEHDAEKYFILYEQLLLIRHGTAKFRRSGYSYTEGMARYERQAEPSRMQDASSKARLDRSPAPIKAPRRLSKTDNGQQSIRKTGGH